MRLFSDHAGGSDRSFDRPRGAGGERVRASTVGPAGKRGMAILLVLVAIAVLTAVVVEFSYDTRVDSTLAANARDELRAEYMARSATNLSRLVLHFQHQIDTQMGAAQQAAGAVGMGSMIPKIRLWELMPVESGAINTFIGAISKPPSEELPPAPASTKPGAAVPTAGLQSFGSFEGSFSASISDEESKINLNKLNNPGQVGAVAVDQLMLVWNDPKWNFLFDEDNSHRERFTREELALMVRDWIDEDESGSAIDRVSRQIVPGAGDEVGPYTKYKPSYKPKNARMDSLAEINQVAGMSDRMLAAFGDRFTVFPDINSKLNINTSDRDQLYMVILAVAADPTMPALRDPVAIQKVMDQIELAKMFGPATGLTVQQFVGIVEGAGILVKPEIKNSPLQNNFVDDKSQTFRIEAVGTAGDVSKKIVSVVRYDEQLGKLLYYRED